jgi:hypothetical protein
MTAVYTNDVEVDKHIVGFLGKLARYKRHLITPEFPIIEGE